MPNNISSPPRVSFEQLEKQHGRAFYGHAYRLCLNREDAEDIYAEALVKAYLYYGKVRSDLTFVAWMNKIITRVFITRQSKKFRRPLESLDAIEVESSVSQRRLKDSGLGPEELAIRNDLARKLKGKISRLDNKHRVLIELFYFESRTYEEISGLLSIPVGTVKSRLCRAKLALAKKMNEVDYI